MTSELNERAFQQIEDLGHVADELRVELHELAGGGRVFDFGIETPGGLYAGIALANVCLSGLAHVSLVPGTIGPLGWPHVQVTTDRPLAACLLSQYAGWQISVGKYFAMGSGAMRAASAREPLFEKLGYRETPACAVGVLETRELPGDEVFDYIAERTGVPASETVLLAAPTASPAGSLQVVARSVETALHKLFELGFDVNRVLSAYGTAPLAPVAADDLQGIGRTNDAVLYGGRVTLWVTGDDDSLAEIGPRVPSAGSESHGKPFLQIFEEAGRDFYQIDPHLFSPAEVTFHNIDTGRVLHFGETNADVLRQSFGL